MSVTLTPAKTYADLLATLRSRCKLHATIGATPALNDILTEANEYVFDQLDNGIPTRARIYLAAGVNEYPFENDEGDPVVRGSVQSLWIEQGDSLRVPLPQGITHAMRADAQLGIPRAWDTLTRDDEHTLEVWPTPDQDYTLHIDHNRVLARFSEPTDKPSAPYRLVLGYAIAMGKAHLQQADADTAGQAFKTMLSEEKTRQRENRRFVPSTPATRAPQIVRTAGGYRQVY